MPKEESVRGKDSRMHVSKKNIEDLSIEEFQQKDLGSEFDTAESNEYVSRIKHTDIVKIYNSESQGDSTYVFVGERGRIETILSRKNAFHDPDSLIAGRTAVVCADIPSGTDVVPFAEIVLQQLEMNGLKRITLIGINEGASVVQALTILSPRLFRKAILINPESRIRPSLFTTVIDRIESFLPVGLPFKASNKNFNSRPFLHRIRCPVLVLTTNEATYFNMLESSYIASKIPNCYIISLKKPLFTDSSISFSNEFLSLVKDFNESPVKRPQKNL